MKKNILFLLLFSFLFTSLSACQAPRQEKPELSREQIARIIEEHPELILDVIEKYPEEFFEVVKKADRKYQEIIRKREREAAFMQTLEPYLSPVYNYRGKKDALITIVKYSDFQCPYCVKGYFIVKELLHKYDGRIRYTFKHLPLEQIHPQAMQAARYYEAIVLQDKEKAWIFHDTVFENQKRLSEGESYLNNLVKDLGLDSQRLAEDLNSDTVNNKITADIAEARKFGINGTPSFVIGGILLKGALPFDEFEFVIKKLLSSLEEDESQ